MMAKIQTAVVATEQVVLEPVLRTKLVQRLKIYKGLKESFELAKAKLEKEAENIEGYFEQAEASSIVIEGYATITEVKGTSSKLDKKKFVAQGGTLAQLENATVTTPKKSYVLITLAKEEE